MRPGRKAFRSFHEVYRVADPGRLRNVRSVKKKTTALHRVWPVASDIARASAYSSDRNPSLPAYASTWFRFRRCRLPRGRRLNLSSGLSFLRRHSDRPRREFITERSMCTREKAGLLRLLATGLRVGASRGTFSEVCNANPRESAGFSRLIQV
jgi:hypothetical protein